MSSKVVVVNRNVSNKDLAKIGQIIQQATKGTNSHEQAMKNLIEIRNSKQFNKTFLWAIGFNPAYFVQYQIESAAILKTKNMVFVVWKPKYIEYPSMVRFPDLKDKKCNNFDKQIDKNSTTLENTNQKLLEFISQFYGTFFYSDEGDFEANLVTHLKHFISKTTLVSYWHVIIDDTDKLFLSEEQASMNSWVKIRISGVKEGYDKTIYLFSFKGRRDGFISAAKGKWIQLASFIAMVVVFYSVVACDGGETEGICQYKSEMSIGGAGVMMALIGFRFTRKGKKKAKGIANPEQKKNK